MSRPSLFNILFRYKHHYDSSSMLKYLLQFFGEIFSPESESLKGIVEYRDSPALKGFSNELDILALLSGER